MTEKDLINELKPMIRIGTSKWHNHPVHYMGSTILTSKEMQSILELMIDGYNELSYTEKRKMRQRVFDALKEVT